METGLEGAGAVLVVLLVVWALRHADLADGAWRDATVLALGAVLSICLTALGRSGLGTDGAAASRYAYVTLALLLPLAVLAVDQLLGTSTTRWLAMGLGLGLLLLVSVSTVARNADAAGIREQEQERRVLAAAQLTRGDQEFLEAIPVPVYMPDLDVDAIRQLRNDGKLPTDVTVSEEDVLTARTYLQLQISSRATQSDALPSGIATLVGADRCHRGARRQQPGVLPSRTRVGHTLGCTSFRSSRRGDDPHRAGGRSDRAVARHFHRRGRPCSRLPGSEQPARSASNYRKAVSCCDSMFPPSAIRTCAASAPAS